METKDEFKDLEQGPSQKEQRCFLIKIGLGLFAAWGLLGFGLPWLLRCSYSDRGTFGDQFGSVNSLFAGAAFAGVIYTIWLQRQELRLQRHELRMQRREIKLNRKEMENSTAAQAASAKALDKQVVLAADSARLNGLSPLLQLAISEVTALRSRIDSFKGPGSGEAILAYQPDLNAALERRAEIQGKIEALLTKMKA